ncbi:MULTISPECIES: thioesterase II family protein [Streptomyces]|uniref:Thioesterase II family protein n=1 Tax=Streptomyces ramulosus TaxID=47762 RepID=A0ABW1FI98_9ACTN
MPHPSALRTAPTGPWLRRLGAAADDAVPLVCFPHAGGSAGSYLALSKRLAPHVATWAVQYPGRQERHREAPFTEVTALADAAFAALRPYLSAPYAFFGHSMGAVVAFEVARRCETAGAGPVRLFASGRRAPSVPHRGATGWRDDDALVAELERLGGTAPGVLADPELRALVLPALRADYRAVEGYVCAAGATVGCPLTVLCGDADPVFAVSEAGAWRPHTTGAFDVSVHPGGHFYLDPQAAGVAAVVTAALTGPATRA